MATEAFPCLLEDVSSTCDIAWMVKNEVGGSTTEEIVARCRAGKESYAEEFARANTKLVLDQRDMRGICGFYLECAPVALQGDHNE